MLPGKHGRMRAGVKDHRISNSDSAIGLALPQFDIWSGSVNHQHSKARFEELGHECRLDLDYSLSEGRFRSMDYESATPTARRPYADG